MLVLWTRPLVRSALSVLTLGWVLCFWAGSASAATITLSDISSDGTPASSLDATLEFNVLGGVTLELIATNLTLAPNDFNISELFWNASADVSGLALTSAIHSVEGDVLAGWAPVQTGQSANGFGAFDFSLMDGVGEGNPNVIGVGESITFLMTISGACAGTTSCNMNDFVVAQGNGYVGAAKFVNGPDDPESPGSEDSAFGAAVVPEPGTALLFGLGLGVLSWRPRD